VENELSSHRRREANGLSNARHGTTMSRNGQKKQARIVRSLTRNLSSHMRGVWWMVFTLRERHIRAHAIRKGDQVYHTHKWWVVETVGLTPGDKIIIDRDGAEKEVMDTNGVRILLQRGSIKTILYAPDTAVVRIMRPVASAR
jgi:hypothetical protein